MKAFRVAVLAASALAVWCAAQAVAQSVPPNDPAVRLGGGHGSVPVTSPIFGVVSPSGTSPAALGPGATDCVLLQLFKAPTVVPGCFFQNKIRLPGGAGLTITRLTFLVEHADFSGLLTCDTNTALGGMGPFASCSVQPVGDGTFSIITFFNGSIPFGGDFSMGMRGFNLNTGFPGVALRSKDSSTAAIYELPGLAHWNSALQKAVNDAPRFRCETCRLRTVSYFERDRSAFGSGSIAAGVSREVQGSAWGSSNRPDSDGMPGRSQITLEVWRTSGCEWRVT